MDKIKRHVLPGESGGDVSWFSRQNKFERQEIVRQVGFKRRHYPALNDGAFSKQSTYTYPHILPKGNEKLAFFEPISEAVLQYMADEDIAIHSEVLNLKSSQAACLNFLFPLKVNLGYATELFAPFLSGVQLIEDIHFEYTGPNENLAVTKWLGEPKTGKKGQNRTSIDAAIFWRDHNNRKNAALVEWKYTERSFGSCGAYQSASSQKKDGCRNINVGQNPSPEEVCLLTQGGQHRSRKYWGHMSEAGINFKRFEHIKSCPFKGPFYQLMRQFLIAAYLRNHGFNFVEVLSIGFLGNDSLRRIPPDLRMLVPTGKNTIIDAWNAVLADNVPPMRHLDIEEIMARVDQLGEPIPGWREYIRDRYGV